MKGLPETRSDWRSGQICAVLANIHRSEKSEAFGAGDFIPKITEPEEEPESVEVFDIEANSRLIMGLLGKKDDGNSG